MFQRLLVCTDLDDGMQRLAGFVSSLAVTGFKEITFLHCVPLWDGGEIPRIDTKKVMQAREQLESLLGEVPAGITVQIEVESGRAIDAILKLTKDRRVDLILLGMPNRNLLEEKLFGSTTMGLCQRITVPLMILRPQLIATYTSEELALRCQHLFRCLLIPYNDGEASQYLLERITQLVQPDLSPAFQPHGIQRIHLCWVVEGLRRRDLPTNYQVEAARESLATVRSRLEALGLAVDPVVVAEGDAVAQILETAQVADVSAIAITAHSPNKLLDWSVPRLTDELLRRSWHPLLYFPPQLPT